ncbi:MAG TPA: nitroreductase/quinone reductase family protein [Dehalococcoidia bacterium]|nr:nitroreductase/quinone reductase family protein [Dehalococcoidia bacterium]
MDAEAQQALLKALQDDRLIDITTTGRKSGEPHRIEIGFHFVDGHVYITGRPGLRGWYANLLANPDFTFHVKESHETDVGAYATAVTDRERRREIFEPIVASIARDVGDIHDWVARSPLVEVAFTD